MNCKPGDLAYTTHPSLTGKLVDVLYAAPEGRHVLPDGQSAFTDISTAWVCKSCGAPFDAALGDGSRRQAMYAAISDRWLRPIRPLEEEPWYIATMTKGMQHDVDGESHGKHIVRCVNAWNDIASLRARINELKGEVTA